MNYGYDPTTPGYDPKKKAALTKALRGLVGELEIPAGNHRPYVETDRLYKGVRIRRMTHLTQDQRDTLVQKADEAYCKVMEIER